MSCQELDLNKYYKTYILQITKKTEKLTRNIRSIISHFNGSFLACASNYSTQSVNEHMVKFKGRLSVGQNLKNKPIKWGLSFGTTTQVKQDIYTSSTCTWIIKKAEKRILDPVLFLPWQNALKTRTVPFSLTISSTVHPLSSSFLRKAFMELVLLEWIGKEHRKGNQTNRWSEVITNISLLTKLPAANGLMDDQPQCCSVIFMACNQRRLFNGEWKDQPQKSLVQMLLKYIIKVWVASAWLTKQ